MAWRGSLRRSVMRRERWGDSRSSPPLPRLRPPPLPHSRRLFTNPRDPVELNSRHFNKLSSDTYNLSNLLQGRISHSHLLQIHCHAITIGLQQDNLIATRLIGHYPSHFSLILLNQLKFPNIFPFNATIRVLAEEGHSSKSLFVFKKLKRCALCPSDLTFSFLIKACLLERNDFYVKQIHTHVLKSGFTCNSFVCNGLVAAYGKGASDVVSASKVFAEMPERTMACSWTSLVCGFAELGSPDEVLRLFLSMVEEKVVPENDTVVCVLSVCSNLELVDAENWVEKLNKFVENKRFKELDFDPFRTILVYLYGKIGNIMQSRENFDEITSNGRRSVLPWNVMINTYVQNGFPIEALSIFSTMIENHGCKPNHITMVSVLSACAQTGDLERGIWVHEYLKSKGTKRILSLNKNVGTSLIDMYTKCGYLSKANEVFDQMITKDIVSVNAMIMGFAINGKGDDALRLFHRIDKFGIHPNASTLLAVLYACSHTGLLENGRHIFLNMTPKFSIFPKLEHYSCYIDLLARMGNIEEAVDVVISMPYKPNDFILGSLLGGCLLHDKLNLAQYVSKMLIEVDPQSSAGYVMLSNAFAGDSRWNDVSGLRGTMREKGVRKRTGQSWISVDGTVYEFVVGSLSHHRIDSINCMLDILLVEMKLS